MPIDSRQSSEGRKAILRGVYDDNLRTVRGTTGRQVESGMRRRSVRGTWGAGLLLTVLVLFVGVFFQAQSASGERPPGAVASDGALPAADSATREAARRSALAAPGGAATVAALYGLEVRTVVLDAGHGGADPGAVGQRGLMEKDVTLDVARRLKARLESRPGYRILMTRDEDRKVTLKDRVAFANEHGADLFVSIHVNWFPAETIAPIETFYYGPGSDLRTRQLAARENSNSGYTMAEFNAMTQQLGLALKMQESRDAAVSIQRTLFRNVKHISANVSDWGTKSADFVVLLGVEAPSVLVEIAAISNRAEEARLNTPEHRQLLAEFLEEGIVSYLRQHSNQNGPTEHAIQEDQGVGRHSVHRH